MRRRLIGIVGLTLVVLLGIFAGCQGIRHALVAQFTPEYEPPVATDLKPTYDGKDAERKRLPVVLKTIAKGYVQPTDLGFVPGHGEVLIVLEKSGKMFRQLVSSERREKLLELPVIFVSEQGLLGIAFHPKHPENGLFYLNYNLETEDGDEITRISEWRVPVGSDFAGVRPEMRRVIMDVVQPYQNHNGGDLEFGPDGYLYIGLGDGGWMDDPHDAGQDGQTLLGSMLRIDVDSRSGDKQYGIPADNPRGEWLPEIYAIGLRNPWRYAFTPDGRLIASDVGQNSWEEVTYVDKGSNLGWNVREASHCFNAEACDSTGLVDPIHEYGREEGGSITGGFVVDGKYVFGDFLSGRMWALDLKTSEVFTLGRWPLLISTFGLDAHGRLYVADYPRGNIFRVDLQ